MSSQMVSTPNSAALNEVGRTNRKTSKTRTIQFWPVSHHLDVAFMTSYESYEPYGVRVYQIWYHSDLIAIKVSALVGSCRACRCQRIESGAASNARREVSPPGHGPRFWREVGGAGSDSMPRFNRTSVQPRLRWRNWKLMSSLSRQGYDVPWVWPEKNRDFAWQIPTSSHIPSHNHGPTWTHLDIPTAWINMNWMDHGDVRWHWLCSQLS